MTQVSARGLPGYLSAILLPGSWIRCSWLLLPGLLEMRARLCGLELRAPPASAPPRPAFSLSSVMWVSEDACGPHSLELQLQTVVGCRCWELHLENGQYP